MRSDTPSQIQSDDAVVNGNARNYNGWWRNWRISRTVKHPRSTFASFVDHNLPLPEFPSDVVEVLENGDIKNPAGLYRTEERKERGL